MAQSVGMFQRPVEYRVNSFNFYFEILDNYNISIVVGGNQSVVSLFDIFGFIPVIFWQNILNSEVGSFGNKEIRYLQCVMTYEGSGRIHFDENKLNCSYDYVSLKIFEDFYSLYYDGDYDLLMGIKKFSRDPLKVQVCTLGLFSEKLIQYLINLIIVKEINGIFLNNPLKTDFFYQEISREDSRYFENDSGDYFTETQTVQRSIAADITMVSTGFVYNGGNFVKEKVEFYYK